MIQFFLRLDIGDYMDFMKNIPSWALAIGFVFLAIGGFLFINVLSSNLFFFGILFIGIIVIAFIAFFVKKISDRQTNQRVFSIFIVFLFLINFSYIVKAQEPAPIRNNLACDELEGNLKGHIDSRINEIIQFVKPPENPEELEEKNETSTLNTLIPVFLFQLANSIFIILYMRSKIWQKS